MEGWSTYAIFLSTAFQLIPIRTIIMFGTSGWGNLSGLCVFKWLIYIDQWFK